MILTDDIIETVEVIRAVGSNLYSILDGTDPKFKVDQILHYREYLSDDISASCYRGYANGKIVFEFFGCVNVIVTFKR